MEEDKKLWKIKYRRYDSIMNFSLGIYEVVESDIIKATESEALEWFFQNKVGKDGTKLYYKEDGEWILYKEEK